MKELERLAGTRVLITGADGMLGRAFREALHALPYDVTVHALSHADLDVTDGDAVMARAEQRPDVIVHCAGMALADECERRPEAARSVHVDGTRNVIRLATECGSRIVYPQSVFIFDGRVLPVTEETIPAPPMVYGRMKLEAERLVLKEVAGSLSVRMAGFFGGDDRDKNFVGKFVRELDTAIRIGHPCVEVGDRVWQPTYTLDLARNTLLLVAQERSGIYNMGALGEATFFDVARVCTDALSIGDLIALIPSPAEVFSDAEPARRPHRMVTANLRLQREGLLRQRPWGEALREYLARPWFDQFRHGPALDRRSGE